MGSRGDLAILESVGKREDWDGDLGSNAVSTWRDEVGEVKGASNVEWNETGEMDSSSSLRTELGFCVGVERAALELLAERTEPLSELAPFASDADARMEDLEPRR